MNRLILSLALVVLVTGIAAGGNTGKITGIVKDAQTGETLVGANVVIEGTMMGAATNIDGYYVILNIPPGKYIARGFRGGIQQEDHHRGGRLHRSHHDHRLRADLHRRRTWKRWWSPPSARSCRRTSPPRPRSWGATRSPPSR